MPDTVKRVSVDTTWDLTVGRLSRQEIAAALRAQGVALNEYAEALLDQPLFDGRLPEHVRVVTCTVAQLGLGDGGTWPQILSAAEEEGLMPCPADTAPYLRLAWSDQPASSSSVLRVGGNPDDAVTVAAPRFREDDEFPRGFYLRVVDGVPWLRGYRCEDAYVFPADARLAFRARQDGS